MRSRNLLGHLVCVWYLCAAMACGAEMVPVEWDKAQAVIDGPAQAAPGTLVILDGSQSAGNAFAWTVVPPLDANVAVDSSGKYLYFATPVQPGRWTAILAVAKDDTVSLATHTLVVGEDGDDDDDVVPPPPEALWGIVIHESSIPSPEKAMVLSSQRIRQALSGRWRIADKDVVDQKGQVPADLKPWIEKAQGKELPYLFLVDPTGRVYYQGPLPKTVDAVLQLIESFLPGAVQWQTTPRSSGAICPTGAKCTPGLSRSR